VHETHGQVCSACGIGGSAATDAVQAHRVQGSPFPLDDASIVDGGFCCSSRMRGRLLGTTGGACIVNQPDVYNAVPQAFVIPSSSPSGLPSGFGNMPTALVPTSMAQLTQTNGKTWPWILLAAVTGAVFGAFAGYSAGHVVCKLKRVVGR